MADIVLPKNCARHDDLPQKLWFKLAASEQAENGDAGGDVFSDTLAHTGNWASFQAIGDTVIAAATFSSGSGSLAGKTIKSGERIRGPLTAITLTSGSVICYRALVS